MTPERWREIEALYHSVRQEGSGVLEGCDPELRRQVEELLAHDASGRILDMPVSMVFEDLAAPPVNLEGRRISQYEILERLGAGGMGVVYKARDTKLKRLVALKFLPAELRHDPELRRRLAEEARAASALDHPNIVVIHEIHDADDEFFIAMAYHEGTTLRERLREPIPVSDALGIARQVAAGLARAHEHGIVHRDIKPSNLIVARDGVVRIIDFGLARPAAATGSREDETRGTPLYMSPEQVTGKKVDARTDLWSLGVVLHEMLAGKPPFRGDNMFALMRAIAQDAPAPLPVEIPEGVRGIVGRALEKDPARRFQSAAEMQGAMASPSPARAGRSRRYLMPAAAALLAVTAVGAGWYRARQAAPKVKEQVVVADASGDAAFEGRVIRESLALALGARLAPIPEQQAQRTLDFMRKPRDTRLTAEVAREICERTAAKAVIESAVVNMGAGYSLRLTARNCVTGAAIEEQQQRVASKAEVMAGLDGLARSFASAAQAALAKMEAPRKLEEATTDSLEALKSYSASFGSVNGKGMAESIPLLERAIELDPKFAMAYSFLGRQYADMAESARAQQSMIKAYELRGGVSDRENFFLTYNYQRQVARNLEMGRRTLEAWAQKYPDDSFPVSFLGGFTAAGTGMYEKGVAAAERALTISPNGALAYVNLADNNIRLMRLAEAEAAVARAEKLGKMVPDTYLFRYTIAFLRGDVRGMEAAAAERAAKSPDKGLFAFQEAAVLASHGRMREARIRCAQAISLSRQSKLPERAASFQGGLAVWEALTGNRAAAKQAAEEALLAFHGRDADYGPAFALAWIGESERALAISSALAKEFPEDTSVQFKYVPAIEGIVWLNRGVAGKAAEATLRAAPYDLAQTGISIITFYGTMDPVYVRGKAYTRAGRFDAAAVEFRKILDHPGVMMMDPVSVLARLELGRALASEGRKQDAADVYRLFLEKWKDADEGLPLLVEARAEYGRIRLTATESDFVGPRGKKLSPLKTRSNLLNF